MQEKVQDFEAGLPVNAPASDDAYRYYGNFEEEFRNFWNNSNYYCVLAGLGKVPDAPLPRLAHMPGARARSDALFAQIRRDQRELVESLPSCREYLRVQYGR